MTFNLTKKYHGTKICTILNNCHIHGVYLVFRCTLKNTVVLTC